MSKKEKQTPKLTVVKDNEQKGNDNALNKPTPEEVAQFKLEFENAMKEFSERRFEISEPGQFNANDTAIFLLDYLKKYSLWSKTGWMGVIKMKEELDHAMKLDNEKTGLGLDYQALEFCGYMLANPGGVGYDAAIEFEKIADKYSLIMMAVGKRVEEARELLRNVQYLQERWAAGEQGFYLADLEPKDNTPEESAEVTTGNVVEMKVVKETE